MEGGKNKTKHNTKHQSPPLRILLAGTLWHHIGGQSVEPRYFSVLGTMSLPEKEMGAASVMQEEEVNRGAERV